MAALNLFPARVQFVDANGRLTPEAYRALQELYNRVGGTLGDLGEDTYASVFGQFIAEEQDCCDVMMQPVEVDIPLEPIAMQPAAEQFVSEMVIQPPSLGGNIEDVTVGASPYAYTAHSDGILFVSGGTVTPFTTITRGATTIDTGAIDGPFPINSGDVVTVTYTAAPTIKFIPR